MLRAYRSLRLAAAVTAFSAAALAGCSDSSISDPVVPVDTQNNLVFTRANGTPITFSSAAKLYAWCGAWEPGAINAPTVHVVFGGPGTNDPFWQLSAVRANVTIGQPLQFPNAFIFDQPKNADFFLLDPPNEVSTQIASSSGSITFQRLNCSTGGAVEFTINAVIGSEFSGSPSVTASGRFQAPIGSPPP